AALGPPAERGSQPEPGQVPRLRYTVVDRSARSFNPVLDAMSQVLQLVTSRFDVPSVREVLGLPAVRERFGLGPDELGLLVDLSEEARVCWGLDGPHRARWGLPADLHANSWSAGIDQLLAGVAVGDRLRHAPIPGDDTPVDPDAHVRLALGGVAPLSLEDGMLAAAGRVAAAVRSLGRAVELLVDGPARTVEDWCRDLLQVADLLVASAPREDWQRFNFDHAVERLRSSARAADGTPSHVLLGLGEFRRPLSPSLEGPSARADLGYGTVVVTRPEMVANVPFRVVCILGLDQDALPVGRPSGDDLLASSTSVGDRDLRADVRAGLLAAVGAARDHLVVTCTSRDVRSNVEVPRAVVLDELLEVVARTVGRPVAELWKGGDPIVRDHPRQSFAESNFVAPEGRPPFGFDPVALEGAESQRVAAANPVVDAGPEPLVDAMLPSSAGRGAAVDLEDLRRFHGHPVRHFFSSRLSVVVPKKGEAAASGLPVSLDGRDRSLLAKALFDAGVAHGVPVDTAAGDLPGLGAVVERFRAQGALPPEPVFEDEWTGLREEVAAMLELAERADARVVADEHHEVDVRLGSGDRVVGMVTGCMGGERPGPLVVTAARPSPSVRLRLAVDLLLLTAQHPTTSWRGVYLARPNSSGAASPLCEEWTLADSVDDPATSVDAALQRIVAQYLRAGRTALPLFARTSYDIGFRHASGASSWSPFLGTGEDVDPYHVAAFGRLRYQQMVDELRVPVADDLHADLGRSEVDADFEAHELWGPIRDLLVVRTVKLPRRKAGAG
ncbi:MAG: hypothetical protein ACKO04_05190, partial [Actinomycetes bacterium]